MKISIIGGGSFGITLATVLTNNKHEVLVYDTNESLVNLVNKEHTHFFKDSINENILATVSLEEAVDFSDILLLVVPTKVTRIVLENINDLAKSKKLFINASKGIEEETFNSVSEILYEVVDEKLIKSFVCLSGPCHAEELIENKLSTMVAASNDKESALLVQKLFSNNYLRIYTSSDVIGLEMSGSLKNIYAIASGIITGLGFGDNARAALISRGLVEMEKLSSIKGAELDTLYGLSGVGDLIVTCTSTNSRNFQAGLKIGSGVDYLDAIDSITMTVEGAKSCVAAYEMGKKYNIDLPIINATYDILINRTNPKIAIETLMSRALKEEFNVRT